MATIDERARALLVKAYPIINDINGDDKLSTRDPMTFFANVAEWIQLYLTDKTLLTDLNALTRENERLTIQLKQAREIIDMADSAYTYSTYQSIQKIRALASAWRKANPAPATEDER